MSQQIKTVIVIALLLLTIVFPLCGLVGVILLWQWLPWKPYHKVLTTLTVLFVGLVILLLFGGSLFVISYK